MEGRGTGIHATDMAPGIYGPTTLVPRCANPEAMHFLKGEFPGNVTDVISWLGDAFYALTCGKAVSVNKVKIEREADPDSTGPTDNLLIIIQNPDGSLVAVVPGEWIIWTEEKGYQSLTEEQLNEMWRVEGVD